MMIFIKYILKQLFYIIEIFYLIIRNSNNRSYFYILTPRLISYIFKKVIIYNKKKNLFFIQHIRNNYDINTVFQIFGYEEYNLSRFKIWEKLQKEYQSDKREKLIIDCGSNIGSSTRFFLEIFNNVKIFSIEPDYLNFLLLQKNANDNKIKNINLGVASKNKEYKVLKYSDPRAHKIIIIDKKKIKKSKNLKKTITINEILKKEKKTWPFIIKIDIEGFEKELFNSNYQWMNKFKIIIIEIHDWMEPSQSISSSYIMAMSRILKKNKRDLIIMGENLVSVRIN